MFVEAAIHLAGHMLRPIRNYRPIRYDNGVVVCSCGVHGCDKQGKHPVGTGWASRARLTLDPNVLQNMFSSGEHNIAIAIGQCENIPLEEAVIDLESETDAGYALLQELLGDVVTPQWTSGMRPGQTRPGLHSLFRPPTEFLSLALAEYSIPAAGIDYLIGGLNKQRATTVPPSLHSTGVRRMWVPGRSLDDCEIAQLPYAATLYLLDHVRSLTNGPARPRNVRRMGVAANSPEAHAGIFGPVPVTPDADPEEEHLSRQYRAQCQLRHRDSEVYQGDRNNQMHAFACSLWRRMCGVAGINDLFENNECSEMVMDMIIAKNIMACQPEPLPESELNGIFNSSRRFMQDELEHEFTTGTTSLPRIQYAVPRVIANARLNGHAPATVASVPVVAPVVRGTRTVIPVEQNAVPVTQSVVPDVQPTVVEITADLQVFEPDTVVVPVVPTPQSVDTAAQSAADALPPAEDSFAAWKLQYGATYVFDPAIPAGKSSIRRIDEWRLDADLQFIEGCDSKEVALKFACMPHAVVFSESLLDKPAQLAREVLRLTKGEVKLDPKSAEWSWSLLWLGGKIPGKKGVVTGFYRDLLNRASVVLAKDAVGLQADDAEALSLNASLRSGIDTLCGNIPAIRNAYYAELADLQSTGIDSISSVNSKRLTVTNDGTLIEGHNGPVTVLTGVYVVERVLSILIHFDELLVNRRQSAQPCPQKQIVACTLRTEMGFDRRRRKNSVQYGRWFTISVDAYLNGDNGDDDDMPEEPMSPAPPTLTVVAADETYVECEV